MSKYGNNVPPYRETEQYVQRVNQKLGKARRAAAQKKSSETVQTAPPPSPRHRKKPARRCRFLSIRRVGCTSVT